MIQDIVIINNVYRIPEDSPFNKGYKVIFGNAYYGYWCKDEKDLPLMWKRAIHQSRGYRFPGDVSLSKDGKLIRGMNNANVRILEKDATYKYQVNKYK